MQTLLQRLKPEVRELLEAERARFPFYVQKIEDKLSNKYFYIDMEYDLICSLNILVDFEARIEPEKLFSDYHVESELKERI